MKVYNKLVRDKIPEIIEADGKVCRTHILSNEEYIVALEAKLNEEVAEYQAPSRSWTSAKLSRLRRSRSAYPPS